MLIQVIGETFETSVDLMLKSRLLVDAYEIRVDLIENVAREKLLYLKTLTTKKILLTLRSQEQGGKFVGSIEKYEQIVTYLASLEPDYLDVEIGISQEFIDMIKTRYPALKIVVSSHGLHSFSSISQAFAHLLTYKADVYKLAITGHALDALEMLLETRKLSQNNKAVVGIVMGERGQFSRILSKVAGNYFTYCSCKTYAPGQLSALELLDVYHIRSTALSTKVFALIGAPVSSSPSHYTHNKLFRELGLDAVYVKILLSQQELAPFLEKAKEFFSGFSVTAPYKEKVIPFLEGISLKAQEIGAVNTLIKHSKGWYGDNTDYIGAFEALRNQLDLQNKRCLVIGSGGASKAIVYSLKKDSHVSVLTRLLPSKNNSCSFYTYETIDQLAQGPRFDVIIQATSCELKGETLPESVYQLFTHQTVIFETLIKPRVTQFVRRALEKKCSVVWGFEMFLYQAKAQFLLWYPDLKHPVDLYKILKKIYQDYQSLDS